jgi:hypothetical protein
MWAVGVLAFSTVGALIASRRPEHPIGWLFSMIGLLAAASAVIEAYLPTGGPGFEVVAWFGNWVWVPLTGLMGTFTVLLFPTGRLASPRWRIVAWLSAACIGAAVLSEAFAPGPLDEYPWIANPFGLGGAAGSAIAWLSLGVFGLVGCVAASAVSLAARYRRGGSQERQQIKWFAAAALVFVLAISLWTVLSGESVVPVLLFGAGLASLPVATGIAILRYRLFDIDLIIRRTLSYGLLTLALAAIYFGSVAVLQNLFTAVSGQSSPVGIVISTLAIAALFSPLRQRVQAFIDRRFYRSRYDAARVIAAFGDSVRDEVEIDRLTEHMQAAVRAALQPASVSLWLKPEPARQSAMGQGRAN